MYFTKTQMRAIWFVILVLCATVFYHYLKLWFFADPGYDFSELDRAFRQKRDSLLAVTPAAVDSDSLKNSENPEELTPHVNFPININRASKAELEELPRIGPKMAERILRYREENGDFRTPEELMKVKGIGRKTFQQLKELVRVE